MKRSSNMPSSITFPPISQSSYCSCGQGGCDMRGQHSTNLSVRHHSSSAVLVIRLTRWTQTFWCPPSFLPLPSFPRLSPLAPFCAINLECSPLPSASITRLFTKSAQTSCGVSQQSRTLRLSICLLLWSSFAPYRSKALHTL